MDTNSLIYAFENALDIIPNNARDDEGVFIGFVSITEPLGLNAILSEYTSCIDKMLADLPLTDCQYLELLTSRSFTYDEYKELWKVKPNGFYQSMICKVLLITTEQDRQLFTSLAVDDSHAKFVEFLKVYAKNNNKFLHNLIYEIYD